STQDEGALSVVPNHHDALAPAQDPQGLHEPRREIKTERTRPTAVRRLAICDLRFTIGGLRFRRFRFPLSAFRSPLSQSLLPPRRAEGRGCHPADGLDFTRF